MQRLPIEQFKVAAYALCKTRGRDPEEPTFYGDTEGRKRPLWVNYAEELRTHYERDDALDEAGL